MLNFDINESYERTGLHAGSHLIAELHKIPNLISDILKGEAYVETLAKYATLLAKTTELYRELILKGIHTREELSSFSIATAYGKELLVSAETLIKEYDMRLTFMTDKDDAHVHKSLAKITKESMRESKENMLKNLIYEVKGMHGITLPSGNYKTVEVAEEQWSIVFRLGDKQFQSVLEVAFLSENKFAHEVMKAYMSKKPEKIEQAKSMYEDFYNFIKKLLENTPNSYDKESLRESYIETFNNWDLIFKILDDNCETLTKAQIVDTNYMERFKTVKTSHSVAKDNLSATKYFLKDLESTIELDDNISNRSIIHTENLIHDTEAGYRKIVSSCLTAAKLEENKELLTKLTANVVKAHKQYNARDKSNDTGKERLRAETKLKELQDILIDLEYFLKKDPSRYKNNPLVVDMTRNILSNELVNSIATRIYIFTVVIETMESDDYESFIKLSELTKVIKGLDSLDIQLKAIDSVEVNHYYLKYFVEILRLTAESLEIGQEISLEGRGLKTKNGIGKLLNDVLKIKSRSKEEIDERYQRELDKKYPYYEITKSDILHVLRDNISYIDFMRKKVVEEIYNGNESATIYVEILDKLDDTLRGKSSLSLEARIAYLTEWADYVSDIPLEELLDMLYAIE